MFTKHLEFMANIYEDIDALLITNKQGIIEYCSRFDAMDNRIKNEGYTGKHILEVYPTLSEETSIHYRVMKTGVPIIGEKQILTDLNGVSLRFLSSTYPIEYQNEIVGTIEGSAILSDYDEVPYQYGRRVEGSDFNRKLYCLDDIITGNRDMKSMKEKVKRIAQSDVPVLIIGEIGTGKELIAQSLHTHRKKEKGSFVVQNCSAIPTAHMEKLLFGTVEDRDAGIEESKGLLEMADQGTLFLDAVDFLDLSLQNKVLKVIEEKRISRIGSAEEKAIDVRVVSAMNQEPLNLIKSNQLKGNLFQDLGGVQLRIPSLRKRREDIPLLTNYFIHQFNQIGKKSVLGVSNIVEKTFESYDWPGNAGELRNTIEYAFNLISGDTITLNDIPEMILYAEKKRIGKENFNPIKQGEFEAPLLDLMETYEKSLIKEALAVGGNVTKAARLLRASRQTLHYKIMKYQLK